MNCFDDLPKVTRDYTTASKRGFGHVEHFGRTVCLLKDCRAFGEASANDNALAEIIYEMPVIFVPMPGNSKQKRHDTAWATNRLSKIKSKGKSLTEREAAFFHRAFQNAFGAPAAKIDLETFVRTPTEDLMAMLLGDAPDLWDRLDPVTALAALGAMRAGPQALTLTLAREGTRWMKIAGAPTAVFEVPQADILRPGDLITLGIETALPTATPPLVLVVAAVEGRAGDQPVRAARVPHVARAGSIWEAGAAPFEPLEVEAPEGDFAFLVITADAPDAFTALSEGPLHSDADLRLLLAALRAEATTPMAVSALHYRVQASE